MKCRIEGGVLWLGLTEAELRRIGERFSFPVALEAIREFLGRDAYDALLFALGRVVRAQQEPPAGGPH